MSVLRALAIALSTFSRIPMPRVVWKSDSMRWSMIFLPVVGIIIGCIILLWNWVCLTLGIGPVLRGAGFALLPLLITGAIHLDGFCDTTDALSSNEGIERRQEILRDPHAGVFAVIIAAAYLIGFAALGSELSSSWPTMIAFACVFVLSRSLAGLATLLFPQTEKSSFASAFVDLTAKRVSVAVLTIWAVVSSIAIIWFGGIAGIVALACVLLCYSASRFWLVVQFGGFSGDLAGWTIQMCELCALVGLVLGGLILALF